MKRMGIETWPEYGLEEINPHQPQKQGSCEPIPLNKVGNYC